MPFGRWASLTIHAPCRFWRSIMLGRKDTSRTISAKTGYGSRYGISGMRITIDSSPFYGAGCCQSKTRALFQAVEPKSARLPRSPVSGSYGPGAGSGTKSLSGQNSHRIGVDLADSNDCKFFNRLFCPTLISIPAQVSTSSVLGWE
jgi:hypothetical protein